jgi:hypothetical protein
MKNISRSCPYEPINAISLYKIAYHPYRWTVLLVSGIYHHPQGDTIQRHIEQRHAVDAYSAEIKRYNNDSHKY